MFAPTVRQFKESSDDPYSMLIMFFEIRLYVLWRTFVSNSGYNSA